MPKLISSLINRKIQFHYTNTSNRQIKHIFFYILLACCFIQTSEACDIVGASACPHKPENDLKEENFEDYCNKYKLNIECIYKKYQGCNKREKYVEAMESMIKGLKKKAKQLSEDCEIDIELVDEKPKEEKKGGKKGGKGKDKDKAHTETQTKATEADDYEDEDRVTTTTGVPCRINTISSECHSLMQNVQFNPNWSGVLKQKWCNSAGPYYNCLKSHMINCHGAVYQESVSYYEKIQKYIHSTSNINCPGGLEGCQVNANDVRCKMGVKYGESSNEANLFKFYIKSFFKFSILFFILKCFS